MLKFTIAAIGRARSGPEADLTRDYLSRFDKAGRAHGLGPATLTELESRKPGSAAEGTVLLAAVPKDAYCIALDERGKTLTSPEFAASLAKIRDESRREVVFVIGGADGLDTAVKTRANMALSFGKMVWPHMLARVMLSEQLYRAATILGNSPYHRS